VTGTKMQTACGQRNDGRGRTIVRSPPRPTAKVGELGREAALATWVGAPACVEAKLRFWDGYKLELARIVE
jgi:hypothetical protein